MVKVIMDDDVKNFLLKYLTTVLLKVKVLCNMQNIVMMN